MRRLSEREEKILLLLKKFDFMTRDQINQYFRLGSIRNTNRILYEMSNYLMKIREGYQTIYYLSKQGRAYADCEKIRKKGVHVRHTIMRNDMWLFYDSPYDWKNEIRVSDGATSVIADAMFSDGWDRRHLIEVDHTQTMKENRNKIKRYKELFQNGLIEEFPTVVWLTTTEHRRKQLKETCGGLPVVMVFTVEDIK